MHSRHHLTTPATATQPVRPAHGPHSLVFADPYVDYSALVLPSDATVSTALRLAFEREFDIIPITERATRNLFGWAQISQLDKAVQSGSLSPEASLQEAALPSSTASTTGTGPAIRKFPKRAAYKTITPETPLADLERFFNEQQTFALVTDAERKFVLGVCTPDDLDKFVKRRNPNARP